MRHHQCSFVWALGVLVLSAVAAGCGTILPTPGDAEDADPRRPAPKTGDRFDPPAADDGEDHPHGDQSYKDGALNRRCSVDAPFTTLIELRPGAGVAPLTNTNSLTMSAQNMGILAFSSTDDSGILRSVRLVGDELVAAPATSNELDALQSIEAEAVATLTPDGLVVAVDRVDPNGSRQLWMARRNNTNVPFGPPIPIIHQLDAMIKEPVLSPTGARMYFTLVENADDNEEDIYVANLDVMTGLLRNPTKLSVSTPKKDGSPVVSMDELEIFYATATSSAGYQTFHATRKSISEGFGPGTLVSIPGGPAATTDTSYPTWLSADACDLYTLGLRNGSFSLRRLHRQ